MKVVILAGGRGTRISEYTNLIPKPMIKVLGKPIILRIMDHYARFGHKDFYIATGYKSNVIKKYFKKKNYKKYNINLIYTGLNTMTGGRIKRLNKFLNETFLVTYGDGLSNININKLINFHKKFKNKIIFSVYKLKSQFGLLKLKNSKISNFKEKPDLEYYFNIGFFLFDRKKIKFLDKFKTFKNFLESNYAKKNLRAFLHNGKHITINTLNELNQAKQNLIKIK